MALNSYTANFTGTGPTMAQPTTSETIDVSGGDCFLLVNIAGPATTITIVVPGNDIYGTAKPDINAGSLVGSAYYLFRIPASAAADTGLVTVTFSQVTSVTASIIRI